MEQGSRPREGCVLEISTHMDEELRREAIFQAASSLAPSQELPLETRPAEGAGAQIGGCARTEGGAGRTRACAWAGGLSSRRAWLRSPGTPP